MLRQFSRGLSWKRAAQFAIEVGVLWGLWSVHVTAAGWL
jgi:hypothetical protein